MPRKPKPPPIGEMVIQGLSTGKIMHDDVAVDDFTGELIKLAEHYGPWKPPVDADTLRRDKKRQLVEHQRMLLQAVKIIPGHGPHVHKPQEPKLAHNQVLTESGLVITPIIPRKPWRRL